MKKKTETKVNDDGTIELGSDFVEAFEAEKKAQIAYLDDMFADPAFRAMAGHMGIDMTEMDKTHAEFKKKLS